MFREELHFKITLDKGISLSSFISFDIVNFGFTGSSHQQMFYKKVISKTSENSQDNKLAKDAF